MRAVLAVAACAIAAAIVFGVWYPHAISSNSQTVSADRLIISAVTQGVFEDFIPLRSQVAPLTTVFLDAVEGGRVEKKLVDDGANVTPGQAVAVLANTGLQLEVIRSESEVTNQLNNLRGIEIQLERNRADNERSINEINWQLKRIAQKTERDEKLASIGFVAHAVAQDSRDEDAYWRNRLAITTRAQRTDDALQTSQLSQLRAATTQLQANLALARANLDALTIRAPGAGQLTAFEINVGQSLTRGQRLGQIDSVEASKLIANVDEFHLSRVALGQQARLEWEGKNYALAVRKINPQVRNGQFEIELVFDGAQPKALRRGQTLQAKLALGESARSLLAPTGAYLVDSGGNFVFVVNGDVATRKPVKLGRRNTNHVEVLSGLAVDDRIVTSTYATFLDKERLVIEK